MRFPGIVLHRAQGRCLLKGLHGPIPYAKAAVTMPSQKNTVISMPCIYDQKIGILSSSLDSLGVASAPHDSSTDLSTDSVENLAAVSQGKGA